MDKNVNNQSGFDIDEILEEARRIKLQRLKQANFSDTDKKDTNAVKLSDFASKDEESEQTPAVDGGQSQKPASDQSATRTFSLSVQNEEIKTDGEDKEQVKIYAPDSSDEFPDISSVGDELEQASDDGLEQISLDSLLGEMPEEKPDEQEQEEDWEERFRRERRKKAENFKLHAPVGLRLSGEEENNDPSEEPDDFEEEEIEDFLSYEDADAVKSELVYRRRTGWLQLVITGLFALLLIGATIAYNVKQGDINPVLFISLNIFLIAITTLLNHRAVGDGFGALFRLKANPDSITSLLVLITFLHSVIQFFNPDLLTGGRANILMPFAGFSLFLNALGHQMMLVRTARNFQFVSYDSEKYAARIIENRRTACEIGRAAVAIGDPVVCYMEKTGFLSNFLKNSFETDISHDLMRVYIPCAAGAAAVLAVVYSIISGSFAGAADLFTAALCVSLPVGLLTSVYFPMLRAAKRALRHGAMIVGWQAAEEFGEVHALAVDALEVFPSESVLLHGIKTFSGARIDEAILDAAAVSIATGGPLSSVFRRVIQNRTDILKEVDTLVYEQDMGVSGWVGGRRVLIGNRRLLENHGVDVPSRDYESRYTKDGRQVVYLSTAGELSAMFVLSYVAEPGIAKALKKMCGSGITLLVRTCDPNVTEELICQVYNLDPYYVEVMNAPAGRCYEKLIAEKRDESEAVLASNGRLEGTATGITYCRRLLKSVRFSAISQIIGGALGLALAFVIALYSGAAVPPLFPVVYGAGWTVLSWLLSAAYRV
jgi:hypothetical protein